MKVDIPRVIGKLKIGDPQNSRFKTKRHLDGIYGDKWTGYRKARNGFIDKGQVAVKLGGASFTCLCACEIPGV